MPDANDKLAVELTRSMAAGNRTAVEAFYRRYFQFLYETARCATHRDEAFCLDVVQDSVLRIIRSIRAVQSERQLASWLRLVVRTTAYDLLKAEHRRVAREAAVVTMNSSDGSAGEGIADERDQIDVLRTEIAGLDPQLIRIIEMRYTGRLTLAKIGAALGLSTGTVDGRLRRALIDLRGKLREAHHD